MVEVVRDGDHDNRALFTRRRVREQLLQAVELGEAGRNCGALR